MGPLVLLALAGLVVVLGVLKFRADVAVRKRLYRRVVARDSLTQTAAGGATETYGTWAEGHTVSL